MVDYLLQDAFSMVRHNRFKQLNAFIDKHEIEVNERDEKGNTMLCVACQNGHKRMAKIVLRRGADINVQNFLGNTPLHFCFQYGFAKLGAYLITKGADPEIRNNNGFLCTEGLGRNALLTFNQAVEERQRIVELRNLEEGQDWDDGASSVGCLTDRSDFHDGAFTDRSMVLTDRSNYDGSENATLGVGGLENVIEGVEEEEAEQEYYYESQQEQQNEYDHTNQQQAPVVVSEVVTPLPLKQTKKNRSWRPLPTQPKPRPLPSMPRPLPPLSKGTKSAGQLPAAAPPKEPKVVEPLPRLENNTSIDEKTKTAPPLKPKPEKEKVEASKPPPKYSSLMQAFHAKDVDGMKEIIVNSSRAEISATLQATSVSGGAFALPVLLPFATDSVLLRCIGTMAANNRLRSLHLVFKYIRENEVLLDGADVVGSGANPTKALIIKLPKTLVAIDRALAVAASKGRVRASTLLVQYSSNNAIVRALFSAAHHKKASVVQQLLPWAESKSLDQLVTTASTKGDADIMLLLIPYLSTQCETRIVDHAIESAAAHGHLSTVAILWKFASLKSQNRCLDIAKHHKHLEIVSEIEKGEGIFVRKIS